MTREEQMWKAVEQEHGELSRREAFITLSAMEWADKTMIDKACNWIKEHVMIPYEGKFDGNEPPITNYLEWCKDRLKESERVANEFKKAMEE